MFLEEYKGIFVLKGLIERKDNEKYIYRLINIILELTKVEEKESNLTEIRETALKQIVDSETHIVLLKLYADLPFNEDTKTLLSILLRTLENLLCLYESTDEINKVI